jgi:hypothetical protein
MDEKSIKKAVETFPGELFKQLLTAEMLEEERAAPHWKDVDCPVCDSKAGQPCGKVEWRTWVRTAPHAARKRLAASPTTG